MTDEHKNWHERRMLTTDFDQIRNVPQKQFIDLLKKWHKKTFRAELTNEAIGQLTLTNRKAVEAWRAPPESVSFRAMSAQARMLLIYRLIEPLKKFADVPVRHRGKQIQWSDSDDDTILKYYSELGARYISTLIGKPDYSIRKRAKYLGVKSNLPHSDSHGFRWDQKDDPELIRLVAAGVKTAHIAKKFGTSSNTIISHKIRLGLESRRGRPKKPPQ